MKVVKATDYVLKSYTKNDLKRVLLKLQSKELRLEKCYSRGVQFLSLYAHSNRLSFYVPNIS